LPSYNFTQTARMVVQKAIESGEQSWCRTLATTFEDLALRLRAVAGKTGDGIERKMRPSKRIPPARFSPSMVEQIEAMQDDLTARSIPGIMDYGIDAATAKRILAMFVRAKEHGGKATFYTQKNKHEITVLFK
jgi:hypothetical protein